MKNISVKELVPAGVLTLALLTLLPMRAAAQTAPQPSFATPTDAVAALITAVREGKRAGIEAMLGPDSDEIVDSGDDAADRTAKDRFLSRYETRHALEENGPDRMTLTVGQEDWPLPIPLVRSGGRWRWDGAAGKEEILFRRIGHNELAAIETCRGGASKAGDVKDRDTPSRGYMFKSLKGAGGSALLAWPADYGAGGIMTFACDGSGKVSERDLGEETEDAARQIAEYRLDASWKPVP